MDERPGLTPTEVDPKDRDGLMTPEQIEEREKAIRVKRSVGFSTYCKDRWQEDTPTGSVGRCIRRHLHTHGIKKEGAPGSNAAWLKAIQDLLTLDDLTPEERTDATIAVECWELVVTEWRTEKAAAEVIAGEINYTNIGQANAPSAEFPVPAQLCIIPRCTKWAVYGVDRCEQHGGQWLAPEIRQAMIMSAFERLVEASEVAVDTLVDVMKNSKRDDARVAAAREVLDRVGLQPGAEINIHVHTDGDTTQQTLERMNARLTDMHNAIRQSKVTPALPPIDVELVIPADGEGVAV